MTPDEALAAAQLATRQYAKRQMTWFRREKDVVWMQGFGGESAVRDASLAHVRDFLVRQHH
jgi:tRNA dimethylallyltransferase